VGVNVEVPSVVVDASQKVQTCPVCVMLGVLEHLPPRSYAVSVSLCRARLPARAADVVRGSRAGSRTGVQDSGIQSPGDVAEERGNYGPDVSLPLKPGTPMDMNGLTD
jgi:hypothetical protein